MIVFVSTFMSPHIKPLCDVLYNQLKESFMYIETSNLSRERERLGYKNVDTIPYLLNLAENKEKQKKICDTADCVIFNPLSCDIGLISDRVKNNKLTIFISERIFKRGIIKLLDKNFWKLWRLIVSARGKKVYLLCLGGFVKKDYVTIGFESDKCYKFGYFPCTKEARKLPQTPIDKLRLLWVGRMIDWKRPLFAVKTVERLEHKINVELTMIGDGPELDKVRNYLKKKKLMNVHIVGIKTNDEVRNYLSDSDALFVTSNRREGWAAVVNEALGTGVPVIAGNTIGATPYLIEDQINGYVFSQNSKKDAIQKIEKLFYADQKSLSENSIKKIELWNAEIAGKRLMTYILAICNKEEAYEFSDGPMSKG